MPSCRRPTTQTSSPSLSMPASRYGRSTFKATRVTLAPSWPYLEAVFAVGQRHNIRRSFITNGMLLHRYADRVRALDPVRVAVSLDGASPEANDSLRGLPGAFATTVASLEKFLRKAPRMRDRLVVCSCLYTPKNVRSLLDMPRLLARLGVERWALSFELGARGRKVGPVQSAATLRQWIAPLQEAARAEGIQCHVNDEFDFLERDTHAYERSGITTHRVFNPERLYRLDPLGFVRSGRALLEVWDAASARRWNPRSDNAVEVTGYPKLRPGMNARA